MDHTLHTRESILHILNENLAMDKNRMKQQLDFNHSKHYFATRGHVFFHLQSYKQTSLKQKTPQKLASKFYEPYEIIQQIR